MTHGTARCKVILLGEHAVVYGTPAVAVGIDRGVRATAERADRNSLLLGGVEVFEGDDSEAARAFFALLQASRVDSFRVEVTVDIPPGAGLGCSAACGVAIARALDPQASNALVLDRAMAWERVFHGNPSGIDAAVAATGAALYFRRGHAFEPLALGAPLLLCIGRGAGISGTREMVDFVASQRASRPAFVEDTFEAIGALVDDARRALSEGNIQTLGSLLDRNQELLAGLQLSTPDIDELCRSARAAGALGAKLTGAGGGGAVIALVASRAAGERVVDSWIAKGFEGFLAEVEPAPTPALPKQS
jgi:mevalonate kinase